MTLARMADLERSAMEGNAEPRDKEERDFIAEFEKLNDLDQCEMAESLAYELTQALNEIIDEGFDADKILAGENPWPHEWL